MSYYIDQIRHEDLEHALRRMETSLDDREYGKACRAAMSALGGPTGAPDMIRFLIKQETTRLSTPR